MKKVFVCLTFAALVSTGSLAQVTSGGGSTIAERATAMAWRIAEQVKLSEGEYVKVRRLNIRLLTETAQARSQFATNRDALDQALADIQQRYDWDLAAALQPQQYAVYENLRTEFTAVNVR
ncbi:hypothetical protein KLP40_04500 [Hymenobacter sp. NST-14]|uniref:hypothetical protein n=1 Tax=Hymenobacter piscis TaxID=2839984 RepID=UPI001C02ED8E|nr:hypothetical protein [Hymenobacter piscis]MBT9392415.1 hypothetical protein [Hymenobacter piscis]